MFVILMLFLVGFVVAQNNNSNNNENDSDKFPKNNTRHYCQGNTSGVCPDNVIPVCGWFIQKKYNVLHILVPKHLAMNAQLVKMKKFLIGQTENAQTED